MGGNPWSTAFWSPYLKLFYLLYGPARVHFCEGMQHKNWCIYIYMYFSIYYIYIKGKICVYAYVCIHACMHGWRMYVWMYGCMHIYIYGFKTLVYRFLWPFCGDYGTFLSSVWSHTWGKLGMCPTKTYVDARTILLSKGLDGPGCLQSTHRSAHSLWSGTWSESDLEPGDQLVTKCFKTLGQFILYSCYILWTTQHRRRKKTIQNCLYMYGTYTYIHIYIFFFSLRAPGFPTQKKGSSISKLMRLGPQSGEPSCP